MGPHGITRLGTQLYLPDGRKATVVYNSLIGVGCKLGWHDPDPKDFEGTDGNTVSDGAPDNWPWEPDVLLRTPWPGCEQYGMECVGREEECKIMRVGFLGGKQ